MDRDIMIPFIVKGEHVNKILEEDINDLIKGTKVFAYISTSDKEKKSETILSENIAWLDIDYIQYTKCRGTFTLDEYKSWINDEPKTSLKIRAIVMSISPNGNTVRYEKL